MNMPALTQLVLLHKGQAALVLVAIDHVQQEILGRNPQAGQRITSTEALSLKPLTVLLRRLAKLTVKDRVDAPRRRPHRLRVEYDELAALRVLYGRLLDTTTESQDQYQLATALAEFHQPSLNLESHIRLPPVAGPGSQTSLL